MRFTLALGLLVSGSGCGAKTADVPAAHTCDQRDTGGNCDDFLTGYEDMGKADREALCEGMTLMTLCPTSGIIGECDKNLIAGQIHLIQHYYEVKAPHTMKTLEALCTNNGGLWRVPAI